MVALTNSGTSGHNTLTHLLCFRLNMHGSQFSALSCLYSIEPCVLQLYLDHLDHLSAIMAPSSLFLRGPVR